MNDTQNLDHSICGVIDDDLDLYDDDLDFEDEDEDLGDEDEDEDIDRMYANADPDDPDRDSLLDAVDELDRELIERRL